MFLSVPLSVVKGSPITITLDFDELLLESKVLSSVYYSDTTNWKSISVEFRDEFNNQKAIGILPYSGQIGTVQFIISVTSDYQGTSLRFNKLSIHDKANGHLTLIRQDVSPQDSYDMEF